MITVNLLELYNSPFNHEDLLFTEGPLIYRIHNLITNKSYIGRTKVNLDYRFFSAWHYTHFDCYNDKSVNKHLYNSMRKYGLENFELSILSTNPEDVEAIFIEKFDSYHNGYNDNATGLGSNTLGNVWINKSSEVKSINPSELQYYLNKGWELGTNIKPCLGRIWINNGKEMKYVLRHQLDEFISNGWLKGRIISPNLGKIWVNDGQVNLMIEKSELESLSLEWKLGKLTGSTTGKLAIHKGEVVKFISPELLSSYLSEDWKLGNGSSSVEGLVWVNNSEEEKYVDHNEIPDGWELGRLPSKNQGKLWVTNGELNTLIPYDELDNYLTNGWKQGLTRRSHD